MENSIRVYDLGDMLHWVGEAHNNVMVPLVVGEGNRLYNEISLTGIARDSTVLSAIKRRLEHASNLPIHLDLPQIEKFRLGREESPFQELPDDISIFANEIFAAGSFGLFRCETHKKKGNKHPISTKATKAWDGEPVRIKPGRRTIAIAALDDGLYEFDPFEAEEPRQISDEHTAEVDWLFASIYGTSPVSGNYLACYKWVERAIQDARTQYRRKFEENIDLNSLVSTELLNWGRQEKVFRAKKDGIEVLRYTQKNIYSAESRAEAFSSIGTLSWGESSYAFGALSRAAVSYFGSVLEFEQGLQVHLSNQERYYIKEPVARWRLFPKSRNYESHLHVVFENRIEIFCFVNDYLIDQRMKLSGIEFRSTGLAQE